MFKMADEFASKRYGRRCYRGWGL